MDFSNEFIASNQSYTNKDFQSIFPELLDLTKKLTNKYDPQLSNESDPLIVLYKLLAFIADKNNYNIDKNVLETFPLSVTQMGNARQLYDSLGYQPKWYRAASMNLTLGLISNATSDSSDAEKISEINDTSAYSVKIPRFTMFTDDNGQYVYTIVSDAELEDSYSSRQVEAKQGIINDYTINGVDIITLDHLDADLRLYFTDKFVAENGIFIGNWDGTKVSDWDGWKRIDNLESYEANKTVYKFGVLPNSDTCYIQFPQDVSNLIGAGLKIKYLSTQGATGNVPSGTITQFYQQGQLNISGTTDDTISTDSVNVTNINASIDGEDPETLEEQYRNFKKTVGTFDTLVTLRDYNNAVYNLTDSSDNALVSNVATSDRTNDPWKSASVMTLTEIGNIRELATDPSEMTAFDIALYCLKPMSNVYNADTYAQSFTAVNASQDYNVKVNIDDIKSSQHDYIDTISTVNPEYIFKDFYSLNGRVITYAKVTKKEASEIEGNIKTALYKNFNAREVDFGVKPTYEKIIDVIKNADNRINIVQLDTPQYILQVLQNNDSDGKYHAQVLNTNFEDLLKTLLTKMVVGGYVQLYDFNEDFDFDFNQDGTVYSNVTTISTELTIPKEIIQPIAGEGETQQTSYTLGDNEAIYLYSPSYITDTTYGAYIKYKSNFELSAKDYKTLTSNDYLAFEYTDSNSTKHTYSETRVPAGKTITTTFDIENTGGSSSNPEIIGAGDSIDIVKVNTVSLNKPILAVWLRNNSTNALFETHNNTLDTETILDSGEYFLYTNADKTNLTILGSGTKIDRTGLGNIDWTLDIKQDLIDALSTQGLSASKNDWDKWKKINNDGQSNYLSITEMEIVALGKGAQLYGEITDDINNTPQSISNPGYKADSGSNITELPDKGNGAWKAYSRYQLNCGPDYAQNINYSTTNQIIYCDAEETGTCNLYNVYHIDENDCVVKVISNANATQVELKDGASPFTFMYGETSIEVYPINTDSYDLLTVTTTESSATITIIDNTSIVAEQAFRFYLPTRNITWDNGTEHTSHVGKIKTSEYISMDGGSDRDVRYYDDNSVLQPIKVYNYTDIDGTQIVDRTASDYATIDSEWDGKNIKIQLVGAAGAINPKCIIPIMKHGNTDTLQYKIGSGSYVDLSQGTNYIKLNTIATQQTITFHWTSTTANEYALLGKPHIVAGYSEQFTNAIDTAGTTASDVMTALSAYPKFDITYKVPEKDQINGTNPLSATAFLDPNNPYSEFTIPQINDTALTIVVDPMYIKS